MRMLLPFLLFFIYCSSGLTCVANIDGSVNNCDCNGNCIIDYSEISGNTISATISAAEYYVKDVVEIEAQNEITIGSITTTNLTLSGFNMTINTLKATNVWFNTHTTVNRLIVLGTNAGAEYKVDVYGVNEVHINTPLTVNKIISSTSTVFIMNDVITLQNQKPQTIVGTTMLNVLPAFDFIGEKVKMVLNLNITNALLKRLEPGTCRSICENCNAVFERSLTQFNLIITNGTDVCSVVNKGCQFNNQTQELENLNQTIAGFNFEMECDVQPNIQLVAFVNETTLNNEKGNNGSFVVASPVTFHGDFKLRNLVVNSDVSITDSVKIENVAVANGSLTVNELISDQIIASNLTINKYLRTNTLVATTLLIKKGALVEIPDGMATLNGTVEIEENVVINFTQPKLSSSRGAVSKVQAPLILLDGNLTIHHPNIPMIIGGQQVIFGDALNLTVIYHDEGFYNNCRNDGVFLFKGLKMPFATGGNLYFSLTAIYPPLNCSKRVTLIPNIEMCHKNGGDYIALMNSFFDDYDKRNYCQANKVVVRDSNKWYILLATSLALLVVAMILGIIFIIKYRFDKKKEVILV